MQRPLVHLFPFCNRLLMARLSSTPAPPPIDPGPANQESPRTTTIAWVQSVRRHKTKTFLNVNDGSSPNTLQASYKTSDGKLNRTVLLQAVCSTSSLPEGVTVGSAVSVDGRLVRRQQPSDSAADSVELHADSVRLLSAPGAGGNSNLVGAMSHSRPKRGLLRSEKGLAWRHRLPEMSSVLRLRAACKSIVHRALQSRGYLEVDTPILTTTDCEGAGETFLVTPTSPTTTAPLDDSVPEDEVESEEESEKRPVPLHLTVSAQLHLEALAIGLSKVYTLGQTFRAEPSHSRFHLAEFLMLEAESVTMSSTEALCAEIEAIVRDITSSYLQHLSSGCPREWHFNNIGHLKSKSDAMSLFQTDLDLVLSYLTEPRGCVKSNVHLDRLESILNRPFERIPYKEAIAFLERQGRRSEGGASGLNKDDEQAICAGVGGRAVFITDFPATLKPFYCAVSSTAPDLVCGVDLLVPGIGELVGGSVREANADALVERMVRQGLEPASMTWYTGLRGHGGAPHGGFGLGFDRLLLWTLGVYNIRDVVPFPREINKMHL
ncbi:unnamed protein product [Mesocestoides corti]|uniref:Aminoacyl-transfer RNA synthetases class-II family profile domain-containing protein n=1 Tax=Mesocestoides corti TaxID=53468 RepID=A0A158QWD6_MESCO|nr:unnamed protein product [Mesocestoides corti]